MPPSKHALLSPSSSKVWLYQCPAMPNLSKGFESEPNDATLFGSDCHLYAETVLRETLGIADFEEQAISSKELKGKLKYYSPEMVQIAEAYIDKILDTYRFEKSRTGKEPIVLLEQYLEMDYAPDSGGSLDFGLISSDGQDLVIGDLKTGRLAVPKDTPQTKIYALAAYKLYSKLYPIRFIRIFICQPRVGGTSEIVMTPKELLDFEKELLIPGARKALVATEEDARICDHCKWCLAGKNGKCKKYMEENKKC